MRIAIYRTGGADGYFGSQLPRSREDIILIARGEDLGEPAPKWGCDSLSVQLGVGS